MYIKDHSIFCQGLDPEAPYSLGNKTYKYKFVCTYGHKLTKDEIRLRAGIYDGYDWEEPRCGRCDQDGELCFALLMEADSSEASLK